MQTVESIETKRAKRLAVFGKQHTPNQKRKFAKAMLNDIENLKDEIETKKAKD